MKRTRPAYLELVEPTDCVLNQIANEVRPDEINSAFIQEIINRMLALSASKSRNGQDSRQMVGLAAVQLGASKRIITIDVTADGSHKKQRLQVFINPKIVHFSSKTMLGREGCWSCGNICGIVERANEVIIEGLDRKAKPVRCRLTGFVARIAQHEIDHLEGIRFPDRIPLDKPKRLHWVEHAEFKEYRKEWDHWPNMCPRHRWEAMKTGAHAPPDGQLHFTSTASV